MTENPLAPRPPWKLSKSAAYGALAGCAYALMPNLELFTSDYSEGVVGRIIGLVIGGAFGGVFLFCLIAALRNRFFR